jgi:predicted RNA-binding protein with RPS1 domain
VILDIDPRNQRISLGLKQLADDPWSKIEDLYDVGSLVEGTVSKITSFGAFVELEHGIDGLIHISQLSNERVERVRDVVNVGDAVKARVIKIDADDRRIGLSLAAADDAELDYGQESHSGASASRDGGLRRGEHMVDMGDIFASALAERDQADRAADQSVEEVADEAVTEEAADDAVTEEAVTEETADEAVTEETAEEVADEAADDIDLGTPTEQVDDNTEDAALADVSDSSTEEPADDEEDRNRTPA